MKKVRTVRSIRDAYSRRMIANLIGKDPLVVFAATPSRLKRLVARMSRREKSRPRAPGKWSVRETVAHMLDAEIVLAFRLRMALAQPGTRLQAMDQDRWVLGSSHAKMTMDAELRLFTSLRMYHVALLRSLPARAWGHYGIHEERGKESVERMVQLYAGHDVNHLEQIAAALAFSAQDASR